LGKNLTSLNLHDTAKIEIRRGIGGEDNR